MAGSSRDSDQFVLLGRIGAAHGIRGEVRIKSHTADPLAISTYGDLLDIKSNRTFVISKSRLAKGMVIARLKGVSDRNAAEALNGVDLYVPRDRLEEPEDEDEFFYSDLEGLDARLEDGTSYGTVKAVLNYGASDILEIKTRSNGTKLFAFTKQVVPQVNVSQGYLTIVPPAEVIAKPQDGDASQDES